MVDQAGYWSAVEHTSDSCMFYHTVYSLDSRLFNNIQDGWPHYHKQFHSVWTKT